jgi:hypothetical protein
LAAVVAAGARRRGGCVVIRRRLVRGAAPLGCLGWLVFGVVGLLWRHPYWVIWGAALVVLASERGW